MFQTTNHYIITIYQTFTYIDYYIAIDVNVYVDILLDIDMMHVKGHDILDTYIRRKFGSETSDNMER